MAKTEPDAIPVFQQVVMLSEAWRTLARRYIVYDFPDEMAACFHCDVVQCPNEKYETCPSRLLSLSASAVRIAAKVDYGQGTILPLRSHLIELTRL